MGKLHERICSTWHSANGPNKMVTLVTGHSGTLALWSQGRTPSTITTNSTATTKTTATSCIDYGIALEVGKLHENGEVAQKCPAASGHARAGLRR